MFEPSPQIASLLSAFDRRPGAATGLLAMAERAAEFDSPDQARLAGIALDPVGRALADEILDGTWCDEELRRTALDAAVAGEVIIGSGFHAATYAAGRVRRGFARPLVLERGPRAGGTFAMTQRATFHLNSRNRAGVAGLAGDEATSPNHLPGAPIQAANVSMSEFQTNADLAFVIRVALAQYAHVVTDAKVVSVAPDGSGAQIVLDGGESVLAGRVIDARGLGDPRGQGSADAVRVLTFPQFMRLMSHPWPLRGVRRAAVIGGGDAGKCSVEALLGIGPEPFMASAALDQVGRIDWYGEDIPTTCPAWRNSARGRYQGIGRYLRPDATGGRRLVVQNRRVQPVALPDAALIDGRTYDLAVLCTGYEETVVDGLELSSFTGLAVAGDTTVVARRHRDLPAYRVGPHAQVPFAAWEQDEGLDEIPDNRVSLFRTATRTAALAATLGPTARL